METYHGYKTLQTPLGGSVVAVGNFDGVHLGHQEIIQRVIDRAKALDLTSVVYTFAPHPVKLLAPHAAPPLITPYAQKRALLGVQGVDVVVEEPFTREYAAMSPEAFVSDILGESLGCREIFVGYDFRFGRGGAGDIETLQTHGAAFGLVVHHIDPLSFQGVVASSTKVRGLVQAGQVERAAALLGRDFAIDGVVEAGEQRGRTIGFPTANLGTEQELLPAHGVYACWAEVNGHVHPAVVNVGVRPTVKDKRSHSATIEAHILDFDGDLYDAPITLSFKQRLRAEQAFGSLDELRQQITRDVEQARACLLAATPPSTHPPRETGLAP